MATHLLTGSGSGIGKALARRLCDRGDVLFLIARNEKRASELASGFEGAQVIVADLSDPAGLADTLRSQPLPDRLESLVHLAGVVDLGSVADLSTDVWRETLDVNLVTPAELTRIFLPALRAARGHVVFVNSGAGLAAHSQWGAYAASKHGLRALADSLREEERERGVRVTSIYPGRVATAMQAKVHEQEGKDYDPSHWIDPSSVATTILAAMDLPDDAEVTDLSLRPGP